jgi:hypothetical protein
MATIAVAALASLVHSEAITIKFQALSLFTVTMSFFLGAGLFRCLGAKL